jgi:hypothetical protein
MVRRAQPSRRAALAAIPCSQVVDFAGDTPFQHERHIGADEPVIVHDPHDMLTMKL